MKPKLTVAVAAAARPVSVRMVAASMMAVAVALGAALVVPAVSGIPTGSQATAAVTQQADWGQPGARQRGILNARNFPAANEAVMLVVQAEPTPAI